MITIKVNTKDVERGLSGLRSDFPWVISNTINDLLKEAQTAQYQTMRRNFTIRNETFLKYSVRLAFANRRDLSGRLFIADIGGKNTSQIWNKFEGGGTKTPTRSQNLSIPSTEAWGNRARPLPARNKPRNMARSFVIKSRGKQYIFNRKGTKSKKDSNGRDKNITMMFTLKSGARIPDKLNFYSTVVPIIDKNYNITLNKLLQVSLQKRGFA
jgi:hypothetical protein